MTVYSLDVLLYLFRTVCCSMSSSNFCFLTCIQVSQEAGKVIWYSHLFKDVPQFVMIHTVKGFGIVNKAEVDVFLEVSCIFSDPVDVGNLISGAISSIHWIVNKYFVISDIIILYIRPCPRCWRQQHGQDRWACALTKLIFLKGASKE